MSEDGGVRDSAINLRCLGHHEGGQEPTREAGTRFRVREVLKLTEATRLRVCVPNWPPLDARRPGDRGVVSLRRTEASTRFIGVRVAAYCVAEVAACLLPFCPMGQLTEGPALVLVGPG